jgi:hypothetical protein
MTPLILALRDSFRTDEGSSHLRSKHSATFCMSCRKKRLKVNIADDFQSSESKIKLSLQQVVDTYRVSRQSAQRWGWRHPCAPVALSHTEIILVLISVRDWVNPMAIVRLQELAKLKKKIIQWCNSDSNPRSLLFQIRICCCEDTYLYPNHYSVYWRTFRIRAVHINQCCISVI